MNMYEIVWSHKIKLKYVIDLLACMVYQYKTLAGVIKIRPRKVIFTLN